MYVDKTLSGIQAVQTLSRLNRANPKTHDVFVLDFLNDAETIRDAFADFYRATILMSFLQTGRGNPREATARLRQIRKYPLRQFSTGGSRRSAVWRRGR